MSTEFTTRLLRIAEAVAPPSQRLPAADNDLPERVRSAVEQVRPGAFSAYLRLVGALDTAGAVVGGRPLGALDLPQRITALHELRQRPGTRWLVRVVESPIKIARAADPRLKRSLGIAPEAACLPQAERPARWQQRVSPLSELDPGEILEVDAVVVGTGAGGAPVARGLAKAGQAVVMLEEGELFTRADLAAAPLQRQARLYRPMDFAVGNGLVPIPTGRAVGGTTAINSGTCFATPDSVLQRWDREHGLSELNADAFAPYLERVLQRLHAAPAECRYLAGSAEVIRRGASQQAWQAHPLLRNAEGCDGQGECCFGCPTGAKRSTDVSYVPDALDGGAMLFTGARVERILTEGGRAVGVVAHVASRPDRKVTIRARAVVLACGTLQTPLMLLRDGLEGPSGQVGDNLTIHPASHAWARMDEAIRGFEGIPQGTGVDALADEGIRFEGAFPPLEVGALTLPGVGHEWTERVESYDRLAFYGLMIADTSRGRVRPTRGGRPRIWYWLCEEDRLRILKGQAALARMFIDGGAREVWPGIEGAPALRSHEDVRRFEQRASAAYEARDLSLTAYHPLGTCRLGADPSNSVIGANHELHHLPGLFICDGSAVPGPLGVNPQVTIMALSERAAEVIATSLDRAAASHRTGAATGAPAGLHFEETMSGHVDLIEGGRRNVTVELQVSGSEPSALLRQSEWQVRGTMTVEGLFELPCSGSLAMDLVATHPTLLYTLSTTEGDGLPHTLRGDKRVDWAHPVRGFTTLRCTLQRGDDAIGHGTLRFRIVDVPRWLMSFSAGKRPA